MEVPICICFSRQNLQLWFILCFYLFVPFASLVGTCPEFTSGDQQTPRIGSELAPIFTSGDPREPSSFLGLVGWEDSAPAGALPKIGGEWKFFCPDDRLKSALSHSGEQRSQKKSGASIK